VQMDLLRTRRDSVQAERYSCNGTGDGHVRVGRVRGFEVEGFARIRAGGGCCENERIAADSTSNSGICAQEDCGLLGSRESIGDRRREL